MAVEVAELPHIDRHNVGVVGSLGTQVVMGFAALSAGPSLSAMGWRWYGLSFLVIAATYAVVRHRMSSWWFLVWPALCLLRLLTFAVIDPAAGQLVTGLTTLCFLYAGLTQPQGRSLILLPPAVLSLVIIISHLSFQATLVRVGIAVLIWAVSAELPSFLLRHLTARQDLLVLAARTDVLTGARNRFGLDDTLQKMRGSAYLVIVDLDKFKGYNDHHGHTAGDQLLADFADMLHQQTRDRDVVVRYGGEEFLVVLAEVDLMAAEKVVDRWAATWRRHHSGVTFSAGITDLSGDDSISMADAAMYQAKTTGRDRTVVSISAPAAESGRGPR